MSTLAIALHTFRSHRLAYALLTAIFMLYVVIDSATTSYLIQHHPVGINGESNPIAKILISEHGWLYMMGIKFAGFSGAAIVVLLFVRRSKYVEFVNFGLLVMVAFDVAVQVNNLYHIGELL